MGEEKKNILAIGAHYEECEYCCGGLIANYTKQGHSVTIVNVAGDLSIYGSKADVMKQESLEAARVLGAEKILLPFKGGCIPLNYEPQRMIAEIVKEREPDVALIHWPLDYHVDHVLTAFISYNALRWAGSLLGIETGVKGPREIYAFEQRPGQTMYFEPDTLVDVTDTMDLAAESMRKFKSLGKVAENYVEEMYALRRIRGFLAGVKYAEAYRNVSFWPMRFPKKILG
ncbi:MAG: PIG-L family deacetylase [Thermoproteota archaeon]